MIAFVAVLCGATGCAGLATYGRAKKNLFRDFLKLKHAIPSHDTFSMVFRDVVAIDGKALRGARGKAESARTRMMVSACAARLHLTLASRTAGPPDRRQRR